MLLKDGPAHEKISKIYTPINFTFVNDSYGGYIKWKVDGTTIMSNDDPTGKTWTDDLSPYMKKLLWKDLGLR